MTKQQKYGERQRFIAMRDEWDRIYREFGTMMNQTGRDWAGYQDGRCVSYELEQACNLKSRMRELLQQLDEKIKTLR